MITDLAPLYLLCTGIIYRRKAWAFGEKAVSLDNSSVMALGLQFPPI